MTNDTLERSVSRLFCVPFFSHKNAVITGTGTSISVGLPSVSGLMGEKKEMSRSSSDDRPASYRRWIEEVRKRIRARVFSHFSCVRKEADITSSSPRPALTVTVGRGGLVGAA